MVFVDIVCLDVRLDIGVLYVYYYVLINVKIRNVFEIMDCVKFVSQVIGEFIVIIYVYYFVIKICVINLMVGVVKVVLWESLVIYVIMCVVQDVYVGYVIYKVEFVLRDVIKIGWEFDVIVCIDFFIVLINLKINLCNK